MALLVINNEDFSSKLKAFSLSCNHCGSQKVTLDIDWASYPSCSWSRVTVICDDCHHDEYICDW